MPINNKTGYKGVRTFSTKNVFVRYRLRTFTHSKEDQWIKSNRRKVKKIYGDSKVEVMIRRLKEKLLLNG